MKTLLKLLAFIVNPAKWPGWKRSWVFKLLYLLLIAVIAVHCVLACLYPSFFRLYTGDKTGVIVFDTSVELSDAEFERLALKLERDASADSHADSTGKAADPELAKERNRLRGKLTSQRRQSGFDHIKYFREAGIRQYEGPATCLKCHKSMKVTDPDGSVKTVDTMEDLITSTHFQLFRMGSGFSTVGYDGRVVNKTGRPIPVGKIDRACGIPGSFTWTGWAAQAEAKPKDGKPHKVSEGCGQCHIGGMYGPPSDLMMPVAIKDKHRIAAIDCLLCHSSAYDMNHRYVVEDDTGTRWNQDRSMQAAMTVGRPDADMCLRCHQHNMGGDTYVNNAATKALGHKNPRLSHNWSKRGTPMHPDDDVHIAAGMDCLDCHTAVGHKIARGQGGVDLVSNDLPDVEVSCTKCHTNAPHMRNKATSAMLNGHTERLGCETCHITKLQKNAVVLIDWINPVFHEDVGVWSPNPILRSGDMRVVGGYLWYNGTGSFLANALGDNPSNPGVYNPLMSNITQYNRIKDMDIKGGGVKDNNFLAQLSPELLKKRGDMVEKNIKPHMALGKSKIYPFHLFNAYMYEDMNNQGPFGAMIMPFDYTTYFETGDPLKSVRTAIDHPIVKRMYQYPFKKYMMDEFMYYFGIEEGWKTDHPNDPEYPGKLEAHWMRQMGTIALNHGISARGFACTSCHTPSGGLLDFKALGYTEEQVKKLENPETVHMFKDNDNGVTFEELYGPGEPKITGASHADTETH